MPAKRALSKLDRYERRGPVYAPRILDRQARGLTPTSTVKAPARPEPSQWPGGFVNCVPEVRVTPEPPFPFATLRTTPASRRSAVDLCVEENSYSIYPHGTFPRRQDRVSTETPALCPDRICLAGRPIRPASPASAAGGAAGDPGPRGCGCRPGAVVGGELVVPGRPQADGVVLSGERRALQGAARDVAAVRAALSPAFHVRHHARPPGRAGPGRRRGQSRGEDVLAVASDVESLRAVPARVERGGGVPDHRCGGPGGAALLHSPPRGGRRGRPARPALLLVQRPLHSRGAQSRRRADRRAPGSRRGPDAGAPADRRRHAGAEAGPGRRHPPVWLRAGRRLRATRVPADGRAALWRPRRQPLPCACQRAEATVRPAGGRRVANRFPRQDVGPPAFLASGLLICQNRRG